MSSIFEITEVERNAATKAQLWSIDFPPADFSPAPGPLIYGERLQIIGWAMSRDAPAAAIEAEVAGEDPIRVVPEVSRPDVAAAFPNLPHAGASGFSLSASVPESTGAEIVVSITFEGGERVKAAVVRLAARQREPWPAREAPLVSVVIPCYNQGRFLREAIESVQHQTYPNVEVIVVDDGSTDETPAVAGEPSIRYIRQENKGLAGARNRGLAEAAGEFVVFLDADDRLARYGIEANADAWKARPEAAFACGWGRMIASSGTMIWPYFSSPPLPPGRDPYAALLDGTFSVGCPAQVLYRRASVVSARGFDSSYPGAEDYDLYLRLAREHTVYLHNSGPICDYRRHGAGMARNAGFMLASSLAALRAQREWTLHDGSLRAAYRDGIASIRDYFGEPVARDLAIALRSGRVRKAARAAWTLLRYHPRGLKSSLPYLRDPSRPALDRPTLTTSP